MWYQLNDGVDKNLKKFLTIENSTSRNMLASYTWIFFTRVLNSSFIGMLLLESHVLIVGIGFIYGFTIDGICDEAVLCHISPAHKKMF